MSEHEITKRIDEAKLLGAFATLAGMLNSLIVIGQNGGPISKEALESAMDVGARYLIKQVTAYADATIEGLNAKMNTPENP